MTPYIMNLRASYKNGDIDLPTFNDLLGKALRGIQSMISAEDKAARFDELMETEICTLTTSEYGEKGYIWIDDDSRHYAWEGLMTTLFGRQFFNFHNSLYES